MTILYYELDAEIVADTATMPREEWLVLRRQGLGGSDAAASMGLSPYMSPLALYLDKVDPAPDEDKEIFEAGRRAEPLILKWFGDQTGMKVESYPVLMRSKRWSFMLANVDAIATDEHGEVSILEAKNVGSYGARDWDDGPPLHVRLQGQHYLAVTGAARVYFAALIGGNHFTWFCVDRDEELIADMVKAEERMWTMIQMRRMPDVDGSESTKKALKAHYGTVEREEIEVSSEFLTLLHHRRALKATVDMDQSRLDEIENKMIVAMQGAEIATHQGEIVATWKSSEKKSYTVKASTSRRWNIPKKGVK